MSLAIARLSQAVTTPAGRMISTGVAAMTGGTAVTLGVQYGAGDDFSKPAPAGELAWAGSALMAIGGSISGLFAHDGFRAGHHLLGAAVGGISAALVAVPMIRRGIADS